MAGELLTSVGQIQVRDLVIGRGTRYPIDSIEGLGVGEVSRESTRRPLDDGVSVAGPDTIGDRQVIIHLGINADDADHLAELSDALALAWQPVRAGTIDAVYWRRGVRGKQIIRCRPGRLPLPEGFWEAHGQSSLPAELWMPDPYLYAIDELSTPIVLANGATTLTSNVAVGGTGRTRPIVEIQGPARNPSVTVARPDGTTRAIRFDIDVQAGQTFVVDVGAKSITLAGVRRMDARAPDHQWPDLLPGINAITFARSGAALTGAGATATIRRRNAWRG